MLGPEESAWEKKAKRRMKERMNKVQKADV